MVALTDVIPVWLELAFVTISQRASECLVGAEGPGRIMVMMASYIQKPAREYSTDLPIVQATLLDAEWIIAVVRFSSPKMELI